MTNIKNSHADLHREPIGHKEIVGVVAEAFRDLGSDAILPALLANDEPIFAAMGKRFLTDIEAKLDAARLRDLISRRNELQKAYLDRWMATKTGDSGPIDGIIAPVSPAATPRLGLSEVVYHHGYTAFVNLLGRPICPIVPFLDHRLFQRKKLTLRFRLLRLHVSSHICRQIA
jgi:amidase